MGTNTILLGGYTGYCTIDGNPTLMTSYSISVSTNVIKSQAAMPFWVKRTAGYGLRDYPVFTLSVEIEPTENIFHYLMNKLFPDRQGFAVSLVITDNTYSLTHTFGTAYLGGLECSVPNNGACTMSLTFAYFGSSWETKFSGQTLMKYNIYEDGDEEPTAIREGWEPLVGAVLMPYYCFGVKYSGYPYMTLYEFSFSFNQEINPKFYCYGSANTQVNAAGPSAIVWGLPTIGYSLTYVMAKTDVDVNDYTRVDSTKIVIGKNGKNEETGEDNEAEEAVPLSIWYKGEERITFGTCYPDTHSPSLVNKGAEANKYSISGSVYGKVKYSAGSFSSSSSSSE